MFGMILQRVLVAINLFEVLSSLSLGMQQSPKNVEGIGLADSGSQLPCLACLLIRSTASFCEDDDEDAAAAQPYCRSSKRSKGKADSVLSFWVEISPKGEGRCLPQSQSPKATTTGNPGRDSRAVAVIRTSACLPTAVSLTSGQ